MAGTNDFVYFCIGTGANTDTQATYLAALAALGYPSTGFNTGTALANQLNKVWRQGSAGTAVLGAFVTQFNLDFLDAGNLATLLTNYNSAVKQASGQSAQVVTFSATPVFDCSKGQKFEITLTGNVTSSTITNVLPGMSLVFTIKQDATGGRTFVPPASVPLDTIDPTANAANVQTFEVSTGSVIRYSSPMMVNPA
jgi:hypothetical protein